MITSKIRCVADGIQKNVFWSRCDIQAYSKVIVINSQSRTDQLRATATTAEATLNETSTPTPKILKTAYISARVSISCPAPALSHYRLVLKIFRIEKK